ncbi:MAG: hypothetical protein H6718_22140 [Polyangiaceae bacterium]|nr:hypothetical protein [Polyangiaceae bacterium]
MTKHTPFILLLLAAACSNTTDLGSGQNQGNLSDGEVICQRVSELPCGVSEATCMSGLADQDELAASKGCTAEVDSMLKCFRDQAFICEDGEAATHGCQAQQDAAGTCIFGNVNHGSCGGSGTGVPGGAQTCDASCDDGGQASCAGDGDAVSCICQKGPQAGHEFALLSCQDLETAFLTECYTGTPAGSGAACGGSGTTTTDGRDLCDASCTNGVDVSCEGPEGGPVVCSCGSSGREFALTSCDELPSRVPAACE